MKKVILVFIVLLTTLSIHAGDGYYSKGVKYDSFFHTTTENSFCPFNTLAVIFYEQKPTPEQAHQLLEKLLEATATLYSDKDIMASASFIKSPRGSNFETPVELKKGKSKIIWRAKTKEIEFL